MIRAIVPHIAALVVVAGCAWLTQWQVDRAADKREILERWHDRRPVELQALNVPFSLPQPIRAVGIWDPDHQILIDNRVRDRRAGVHVLTPFELSNGRIFLINRGWAAWPSRTAELPDPDVSQRKSAIQGVLNVPPGTGIQLGESQSLLRRDWPILATYFDQDRLAEALGAELQPAVVQLDPSDPDHLTGDAWQVVTFGPDRHIGYALTWSTIAIVVAAIWLVLTIRQIRRPASS